MDQLKAQNYKKELNYLNGVYHAVVSISPETERKIGKEVKAFCEPKNIHELAQQMDGTNISVSSPVAIAGATANVIALSEELGIYPTQTSELLTANANVLSQSSKTEVKGAAEMIKLTQDPTGIATLLSEHPINLKLESGNFEGAFTEGCKAVNAVIAPQKQSSHGAKK